MDSRRRPSGAVLTVLVVGLLVVGLGVAATPTAAAAETTGPYEVASPSPTSTQTLGQPARCFPADGTEFVVGTEGPQVSFTLHASLLSAVVAAETGANTSDLNTTDLNASALNATDLNATDLNATNATPAPGAFGIEATASTLSDEIVSLQAGVLYEGVDNVTSFLLNPFEPFALAFDYRLRIPAFEGTVADSEYRESDVPVEGPVEEAACST